MLRIFYSWPILLSLSITISFSISHVMQIGATPIEASAIEQADNHLTAKLTNISYTAAFDTEAQDAAVINQNPTSKAAQNCSPSVVTSLAQGAMLDIAINAPCNTNAKIDIHHNGLMLSYILDDDGQGFVRLPALAENAIILTEFPDHFVSVNRMRVQTLAAFDRTALQWSGDIDLSLTSSDADLVLTKAGTKGLRQAVIVTKRHNKDELTSQRLSVISLSSEACNRMLSFQTISVKNAKAASVMNFDIDVPPCAPEAVDLVLKNLIEPTKLALN